MSILHEITPLILTYNEVPNIERALQKLIWAEEIIVIDSFSNDKTLEVLHCYPQVQVFQRRFDTFAIQCNYGLQKISSEWVLSLDADYILTDELINEIKSLSTDSNIDSYNVRFKYCVFGKPLKGTLLPPRNILYKREKAIYLDDGHAHRVLVTGNSAKLSAYIYHDDRKDLSRWLSSQNNYMLDEVRKLCKTPINQLSLSDRIRKAKIFAPFLVFVYCLILKRGLFDGWHGWYYALQRLLAEVLLAIRLLEYEKLQHLNSSRRN